MKVFEKYNLYDFSQEQSADDENSLITQTSHSDMPLKPINRKISELDAVTMSDNVWSQIESSVYEKFPQSTISLI